MMRLRFTFAVGAALLFGGIFLSHPASSITGTHTLLAFSDTVANDTTGDTIPDLTQTPDTLPGEPDPDELPDAPVQPDQPADGEGEPPVEFEAQDSVVFAFDPDRIVYLYGNAEVRHPKGNLEAGKITLNLTTNIMEATAEAPDDTLSHPVLTRDNEQIRSKRILYNYQTDKGLFDAAQVAIDRGNIHGDKVKRHSPDVVFIEEAQYSTCELDHPHFYIQAQKMKVFEEDEVFFTNAQLYILDIPYPVVFPFGYIPSRLDQEQTGLLEPTYAYQQQDERGIGLQNLGWFQEFNEYLTGQISFDIFTSGTFYVDTRLNYRRVNQYNGNIQLGYSRDRGLESTDPGHSINVQRSLRLQHSHDLTPFSRISANINLQTQDFFAQNSYDIGDRARNTTSSRVSYNYNHPENVYSFRISGRINQNFTQESTTISGPDASFSTTSLTPFERTGPQVGQRWYETFTLRYSSSLRTRFNYNPVEDAEYGFFDSLFDRRKHREATGEERHIDFGMEQSVRGNTQLLSSEFVNFSANFNYNEYWLPQTERRFYNEETEQTETDIVTGFATARDFDVGTSLSTTLYGISNARIGNLDGFRHTLRPSVSYSYNPDFSDPFWGVYKEVEGHPEGETYSRFRGSPVGGPSAGESQSISLSITNRLETRHVTRDSTGEQSRNNISLIDDLRASVSYNFAAEQYKLSDLSTRFRTSIFDNVRLNASANFDFYATDDDGQRIDRYRWQENQGIMQLQRFQLSMSTNFQGGEGGKPEFTQSQAWFPPEYDPLDQTRFTGYDSAFNSQPVQKLHAPWSFGLSFTYRWTRSRTSGDIQQRAILNIQNISLQLTPEWQVGTEMGYDFIESELTPSRFRISRTLHCWNLSFEWNPFDDFPFYMFRLSVNDSQIQSLFQKLPGLNNLERTQSPINRRQ